MKQVYHRFMLHREAFEGEYRFRPLVECVFSAMKRKFCETVRSRDSRARVNEALFVVLCHNLDCVVHASIEFGIDLAAILAAGAISSVS